jgi:putative oxidoreductase
MSDAKTRMREAVGLLILRLAVGGMMLTHGWPKLMRLFETPEKFADPIGLGPELSLALTAFAEVVCASLLVTGAWTRAAAVPFLITMLVAAFIVHGDDPFKKQELALLYGAGAMTLMLTGAGDFSADAFMRRLRERRQTDV